VAKFSQLIPAPLEKVNAGFLFGRNFCSFESVQMYWRGFNHQLAPATPPKPLFGEGRDQGDKAVLDCFKFLHSSRAANFLVARDFLFIAGFFDNRVRRGNIIIGGNNEQH